MVFTAPPSVPKLPFDPPDSVPLCDFILDEQYGRRALSDSRPPFTCGLTGIEYSALQVKQRVDNLARALSRELGWQPNKGTEWDKVAAVFSVNTVRLRHPEERRMQINGILRRLTPLLFLGLYVSRFQLVINKDDPNHKEQIHRLSGISSPANAAYSSTELEHQLRSSGSTALFTCQPLLPPALEAASKCNIPRSRIFLLEIPKELTGGQDPPKEFKTVNQLIEDGAHLPELEKLQWEKGQGARQTAFLCYSSGTSGLPVSQFFMKRMAPTDKLLY